MKKRPKVPAILDGEISPLPFRFFELNERCTVFDDRDHALMKPLRGRYSKGDFEGQVSLFDG